MNRKQLTLLIVLVVVIGAFGWWRHHRQAQLWTSGSPEVGRKLLGDLPVNDVAQIRIRQGPRQVDLQQTNSLWRVTERGDYPADFSEISRLLLKISDLRIVQAEPVGPSQLPRLDLAAPDAATNAATSLALFNNRGQLLRTLWLGKTHAHAATGPAPEDQGWPDGRYVLTASNADTVAVITDPLSEVVPEPKQWLDKTFLKVTGPRRVSVHFPAETNSWELVRTNEAGEWTLADAKPGENLDHSLASETAGSFASPEFTDEAVGLKPEQTGLDKPTQVGIRTFDGFDYAIRVGDKTNDDYFMTVDVSAAFTKTNAATAGKELADKLAQESAFNHWTYLVPSWTLDPLLKKRSQLLMVKPAATETNSPSTSAPGSSTSR